MLLLLSYNNLIITINKSRKYLLKLKILAVFTYQHVFPTSI